MSFQFKDVLWTVLLHLMWQYSKVVTGHITTQPKQSRLAVPMISVSINGIAAELFHPFVFPTLEGKNLKTKISMVKVFFNVLGNGCFMK